VVLSSIDFVNIFMISVKNAIRQKNEIKACAGEQTPIIRLSIQFK